MGPRSGFEGAGIAVTQRALRSLQRCQPARAPIYREGDSYALNPYDDDLDLWLFRPGLRRPKAPFLKIERLQAEPLPGPDQPLTTEFVVAAAEEFSVVSTLLHRLLFQSPQR